MTRRELMRADVARRLAIAGAIALSGACDDASTGPTPGPGSSYVITIAASGATPRTLTVPRGSQVTMTNSDTRNHDMNSDPHPDHTDCPELSQIGLLVPGQSKQSGNLNTAGPCGFHDHNDPTNTSLRGTITVQ